MKHKILIIEPSEVIVEGLRSLLSRHASLKVLDAEADITDIEQRLALSRPDVIIVNPTVSDNVTLLRGDNNAQVLALIYQYVKQSRLRHFDNVIDIRDSHQSIVQIVMDAAAASHSGERSAGAGNYELTKRETAVLVEVARGLTNKEIADRLNVSVYTVTSHRKNIVRKTGIKSVAGLTVYALLNNLIDEDGIMG